MQFNWQLTSVSELEFKTWEDGTVVYDKCSGDTHLVDALSLEIIEILSNETVTTEQIISQLSQSFEIEVSQIQHNVVQCLNNLFNLRILQRHSI